MKIDLQIANAYIRLKAPEFEPLVAHLKEVHQKALEDMADVGDELRWRRLQGRASLAKELLELVESSGELVTKLSRPQR